MNLITRGNKARERMGLDARKKLGLGKERY